MSKIIKIFKRITTRYGMFLFVGMIRHLPFGFFKAIKGPLLRLGFFVMVKQKRIAAESLQIAFGREKTPEELSRIRKECFDTLSWGMVDTIYLASHPEKIKERVSIEGLAHLEAAIRRGRGVLAVTAHFGNFPLMYVRLSHEGFQINSIIRRTRDPKIDQFLIVERSRLGIKTIFSQPRSTCVNEAITALRNQEVLIMLMDQNFGGAGGIFVDFFGQKAATATGPITFHKRTGAQIVPMFIIREKDDHYKITIEPALEIEEGRDDQETAYINISKITRLFEQYIRKYPHEWSWMHRRWKSRPPEAQDEGGDEGPVGDNEPESSPQAEGRGESMAAKNGKGR